MEISHRWLRQSYKPTQLAESKNKRKNYVVVPLVSSARSVPAILKLPACNQVVKARTYWTLPLGNLCSVIFSLFVYFLLSLGEEYRGL